MSRTSCVRGACSGAGAGAALWPGELGRDHADAEGRGPARSGISNPPRSEGTLSYAAGCSLTVIDVRRHPLETLGSPRRGRAQFRLGSRQAAAAGLLCCSHCRHRADSVLQGWSSNSHTSPGLSAPTRRRPKGARRPRATAGRSWRRAEGVGRALCHEHRGPQTVRCPTFSGSSSRRSAACAQPQ